MAQPLQKPEEPVSRRGERIYRERYQSEFETKYKGQFVLIDVNDGRAYRGRSEVEAYDSAIDAAPNGEFYLVKVGSPSVYKF